MVAEKKLSDIDKLSKLNDQLGQLVLINENIQEIGDLKANNFEKYEKIKILYLNSNKIQKLEENAFVLLTNLTHLYFEDNNIKTIENNAFMGLNNLLVLGLNNNQINEINDKTFNGLYNLKVLYLYSNPIIKIYDNAFEIMKELKKLFLHNINTNLNLCWFINIKLEEVTLYDNIVIFKPDFTKITDLNKVSAENLTKFSYKNEALGLETFFVKNSLKKIITYENYKNINSGFEWNDINDSLSLIVGECNVGKTTLLNLIYESVNGKDRIIPNLFDTNGNKHYFNQPDINNLSELDRILNKFILNDYLINGIQETFQLIKRAKNKIYYLLNVFCLNQYLDFLLLIETKQDLMKKFEKLNKERIEEREKEIIDFLTDLYPNKIKSNIISFEKLSYFSKLKRFEYYLGKSDDYNLSPGEVIIWLKDFWKFHQDFLDKEKTDSPVANLKRLVLLDEPDSHMHANLIKEFIELITNENIKKLKFQLIMTSHNPGTVALIPKDNIYEMKRNQDGKHILTKITNKSDLQNKLTDSLYFIKEPFKIVFTEGELGEDKLFYETVCEIIQKQSKKNQYEPIKFQEMGSKKFNQFFLKNDIETKDKKLDEFLFGINDGDDNVIKKLIYKETAYDDYQDNFMILERYCMENFTYDIVNILFSANHIMKFYDKSLKHMNLTNVKRFVLVFLKKINRYASLDDYLNRNTKKAVEAINNVLKNTNRYYLKRLKKDHSDENPFYIFFRKFISNENELEDFLKKTTKVNYLGHGLGFKFNYYPLLLCFTGKKLKSIINDLFLTKFYESLKNTKISNFNLEKTGLINSSNNAKYFEPIDWFFALINCLLSIRIIDGNDDLDRHRVEIIDNFLKLIFDFASYSEYQCTIKEYIDKNATKFVDDFNLIIDKIEFYLINQINNGKFKQIKNGLPDLVEIKSLKLSMYCDVLDFIDKVTKKNLRRTKEKDIFVKFKNCRDRNFTVEKDEIVKIEQILNETIGMTIDDINNIELDNNSIDKILDWIHNTSNDIQERKLISYGHHFRLKYRSIFHQSPCDVLKKLFLENLKIEFPVKYLVRTYKESGFLIDNSLREFISKKILNIEEF